MATVPANNVNLTGFRLNCPPAGFDPKGDLPEGFLQFLAPLHERFTPWQESLTEARRRVLLDSQHGDKPVHCFPGPAVRNGWKIELPEWCQAQRHQMTGPADDAEVVVKMLKS